MCSWSNTYSSALSSQSPPDLSVLDDDDMFDGWFISQRKKDAEEKINVENSKINNSQEVFVVAETLEDAKKINQSNSIHSKMIKKERFNATEKAGEAGINHGQLPDVKRQILSELQSMQRNK